jgi:hypothetical protein
MKKTLIVTAAAVAGFGAALVAPTAVADPRVSVPFMPVTVPVEPPATSD